nr:hypothetical protein [Aeromonadaceae bacterium]
MTLNTDSPELTPASPRIAYSPISFFSVIMGLSGFTIAWKGASTIFFHNASFWSAFAYATSIA